MSASAGTALRSMTGYASSAGDADGVGWTLDVKSVNGRGLDVKLRLPVGFEAYEAPIRRLMTERLHRGTVSLTLRFERPGKDGSLQIDEDVFFAYVKQVADLARASGLPQPDMGALLRLPGVVAQEAAEVFAAPDLTAEIETALDRLSEVRAEEGAALGKVLAAQLDELGDLTDRAETAAANRPQARQERLREAVRALDVAVDGARLEQEIALLAVKMDVTEELDRLRSHIEAGRAMLAQGSPAGRRLEFLSQELNREANTLCSKAIDADLAQIGMAMKLAVDQFREQALNIE